MQCPGCKSMNVEKLSHYWERLPAESPHRSRYAPPDAVDSRYWVALLAVAAGIAFLASGSVLLGLLVAAGGLIFGALHHQQVSAAQAALADWNTAQICLACTGRF